MSNTVVIVVRKVLEEQNRTYESLAAESGIPMRTPSRRLHKTNPSDWSLDEVSVIATALSNDIITLLAAARESRSVLAVTS